MMPNGVDLILVLFAFVFAVLARAGKVPASVAVLLLCVVALLLILGR